MSTTLIERHASTLLITLDRPEARNALTRALAHEVEAAIDELEADDGLRAAVLTGAGGTFCAGMDLKAAATGEIPSTERRGLGGLILEPPAKPLIGAVEGHALAGGFEMALACDLIVAARDAEFGLPEVRRGLVAIGGGLLHLAARAPGNIALELALTGERIGAERLHDLGLVNRLTAPGDATTVALALADEIAAGAPLALSASKRIVRESSSWSADERWERQGELAAAAVFSADAREGITAFGEKRAPKWQGS